MQAPCNICDLFHEIYFEPSAVNQKLAQKKYVLTLQSHNPQTLAQQGLRPLRVFSPRSLR
jgi:hypothetical protein